MLTFKAYDMLRSALEQHLERHARGLAYWCWSRKPRKPSRCTWWPLMLEEPGLDW